MKSPYGVVRNLEANCHDLVPLPIELRIYQSNYSISSWRENFSLLIPNFCKLITQDKIITRFLSPYDGEHKSKSKSNILRFIVLFGAYLLQVKSESFVVEFFPDI